MTGAPDEYRLSQQVREAWHVESRHEAQDVFDGELGVRTHSSQSARPSHVQQRVKAHSGALG